MNRSILLLAIALAVGLGAFAAGSRIASPRCDGQKPCGDTMQWLKQEFSLDDATFGRVIALHDRYKPRCEDLCQRLVQNRQRTDRALSGGTFTPDLDAALREAADLRFESQRLYLQHVRAVASCMPEDQARRYTSMMTARVFDSCQCKGGMCIH